MKYIKLYNEANISRGMITIGKVELFDIIEELDDENEIFDALIDYLIDNNTGIIMFEDTFFDVLRVYGEKNLKMTYHKNDAIRCMSLDYGNIGVNYPEDIKPDAFNKAKNLFIKLCKFAVPSIGINRVVFGTFERQQCWLDYFEECEPIRKGKLYEYIINNKKTYGFNLSQDWIDDNKHYTRSSKSGLLSMTNESTHFDKYYIAIQKITSDLAVANSHHSDIFYYKCHRDGFSIKLRLSKEDFVKTYFKNNYPYLGFNFVKKTNNYAIYKIVLPPWFIEEIKKGEIPEYLNRGSKSGLLNMTNESKEITKDQAIQAVLSYVTLHTNMNNITIKNWHDGQEKNKIEREIAICLLQLRILLKEETYYDVQDDIKLQHFVILESVYKLYKEVTEYLCQKIADLIGDDFDLYMKYKENIDSYEVIQTRQNWNRRKYTIRVSITNKLPEWMKRGSKSGLLDMTKESVKKTFMRRNIAGDAALSQDEEEPDLRKLGNFVKCIKNLRTVKIENDFVNFSKGDVYKIDGIYGDPQRAIEKYHMNDYVPIQCISEVVINKIRFKVSKGYSTLSKLNFFDYFDLLTDEELIPIDRADKSGLLSMTKENKTEKEYHLITNIQELKDIIYDKFKYEYDDVGNFSVPSVHPKSKLTLDLDAIRYLSNQITIATSSSWYKSKDDLINIPVDWRKISSNVILRSMSSASSHSSIYANPQDYKKAITELRDELVEKVIKQFEENPSEIKEYNMDEYLLSKIPDYLTRASKTGLLDLKTESVNLNGYPRTVFAGEFKDGMDFDNYQSTIEARIYVLANNSLRLAGMDALKNEQPTIFAMAQILAWHKANKQIALSFNTKPEIHYKLDELRDICNKYIQKFLNDCKQYILDKIEEDPTIYFESKYEKIFNFLKIKPASWIKRGKDILWDMKTESVKNSYNVADIILFDNDLEDSGNFTLAKVIDDPADISTPNTLCLTEMPYEWDQEYEPYYYLHITDVIDYIDLNNENKVIDFISKYPNLKTNLFKFFSPKQKKKYDYLLRSKNVLWDMKTESVDENILDAFYQAFEEREKYIKKGIYSDYALTMLKYYNVPEAFLDEFRLLFFLYDNKYYRTDDKKTNNKVKKLIKKKCLGSIVSKIEDNPSLYVEIKEMFDGRPKWWNSNSFDNIGNGPTKYIYFMLDSAIHKKAPNFVKRGVNSNLWDMKIESNTWNFNEFVKEAYSKDTQVPWKLALYKWIKKDVDSLIKKAKEGKLKKLIGDYYLLNDTENAKLNKDSMLYKIIALCVYYYEDYGEGITQMDTVRNAAFIEEFLHNLPDDENNLLDFYNFSSAKQKEIKDEMDDTFAEILTDEMTIEIAKYPEQYDLYYKLADEYGVDFLFNRTPDWLKRGRETNLWDFNKFVKESTK